MSTINSNPEQFIAIAQAYSALNNGHFTAAEVAFWDEVWFHNSADFSLFVYLALPQTYQSLAQPSVIAALGAAPPSINTTGVQTAAAPIASGLV